MSETLASRTHTTSFLPAKFEISNDKSACHRGSRHVDASVRPAKTVMRENGSLHPWSTLSQKSAQNDSVRKRSCWATLSTPLLTTARR
jgi:hypothetical protein